MTLTQVFASIEALAKSHSNINTVIFGAESDIDNSDIDGVLMWYDCNNSTIQGTIINYNIELVFLDVLNPDNSNLKDVLSDTMEIAKDMCSKIYNAQEEWQIINQDILQIIPMQHKLQSDYAGHSVIITIGLPYEWDGCYVPGKITPTPQPQAECEPITIKDYDDNTIGMVTSGEDLQVIAKDVHDNIIECTYTLETGRLTLSNIQIAMIYNFTNISTTLTNAAFAGKTEDDIVVLINGTEMVTIGEIDNISGTTITLKTDYSGGVGKVIVF